ncbi:TadE/TadG family type IV pilus assembly protein [Nocardioides mesophilus]|uniref:Pilus assembly protein n=1 Tax=Nocardioides mesophilus TaxID=433659 RepID=A0A7G9REY1_9ACTN|nr:TadE/TadG family type IV pilus assembly protein [Nocardioides mesophilus]QNN54156.1 pilus assembly protein [Nocardioides mesophilus]
MSRPEPHAPLPRSPRRGDQRGTSTLEVAGIAPVFLLVTLVLLYCGFAFYGITATQTAARQAARAASLGEDPSAAAADAMPDWLPHTVSTFHGGTGVRVTTNLPDLLPGTDLLVSRDAVMP